MTEFTLANTALILGGVASALIILRAALVAYLPDRLCGPGGLLIDTSPRRALPPDAIPHNRN